MSDRKKENKTSTALSPHQNNLLFSLLGKRCLALASGAVQVLLADSPGGHKWNYICCGAASIVKDHNRRGHFIRVFDMMEKKMVWEQELYKDMDHKYRKGIFITFEIDDCQAGLNFSDEQDAKRFSLVIDERKQKRASKRVSSGQAFNTGASSGNVSAPLNLSGTITAPNIPTMPSVKEEKSKKKGKDNKKKKKVKLDKKSIGAPLDFVHLDHVGFDSEKGFDVEQMDPEIQGVFSKLGISESELRDKEKANFIYGFLEERGGLEGLKTEQAQTSSSSNHGSHAGRPLPTPQHAPLSHSSSSDLTKAKRPLPSLPTPVTTSNGGRQAAHPPNSPRGKALPVPPRTLHEPLPAYPSDTKRGPLPPEPPVRPLPQPPADPHHAPLPPAPKLHEPKPAAPLPELPCPPRHPVMTPSVHTPPPLPPTQLPQPPPLPPTQPQPPPLPPTQPQPPPLPPGGFVPVPPPIPQNIGGHKTHLGGQSRPDGRGGLLSDIQGGIALKPVDNKPRPEVVESGLAAALSSAFQDKFRGAHNQPEESSESDDDEWDD